MQTGVKTLVIRRTFGQSASTSLRSLFIPSTYPARVLGTSCFHGVIVPLTSWFYAEGDNCGGANCPEAGQKLSNVMIQIIKEVENLRPDFRNPHELEKCFPVRRGISHVLKSHHPLC